jgi:hypothetical protein
LSFDHFKAFPNQDLADTSSSDDVHSASTKCGYNGTDPLTAGYIWILLKATGGSGAAPKSLFRKAAT